MIANFGRVHKNQRGEKYCDLVGAEADIYNAEVRRYKKNLLSGKIKHFFRDANSNIIGELKSEDLPIYRKQIIRYRVKNSLKRKSSRSSIESEQHYSSEFIGGKSTLVTIYRDFTVTHSRGK